MKSWLSAALVAVTVISLVACGGAEAKRRIKPAPTCANGATDYPTCTATPPSSTCTNGATNYPSCDNVMPPVSTSPAPVGQDGALWSLTFADEFSGTSLDTTKWTPSIWYEAPNPTINFAVANGLLSIWPARDATGKFFNRTLTTDGKFTQTYGYFEMEAKLPIGKGVWPGFWIFNHDLAAYPAKRPEIDIMEAYSGGGPASGWSDAVYHPTAFSSTVWLDASILGGTKTIQTTDLSAGFHVYGVDWQPTSMTFYFDGVATLVVNKAMPDPMFVLFSLWYGSASGTPDATTPTGPTNGFDINYVRVWRRR